MLPSNTLRFIEFKENVTKFNFSDKKLKRITEDDNYSISIDAIFDSKRIAKTIDGNRISKLDETLKEMKKLSLIKEQKFYNEFPKRNISHNKIIVDDKLGKLTAKEIIDFGLSLNKKLLTNKIVKSSQLWIVKSKSETKFNSINFVNSYLDYDLDFYIELSLKNKSTSQAMLSKTIFKLEDFDLNKIYSEIEDEIKLSLDPIEFSNDAKEYNLLFSPHALEQIIDEFIINLATLESHEKKDNYLINCNLDKKINIYENPIVDYSPFSCYLDNDFVETQKKEIIKDGLFNSYITTLKDAFKYNKEPTGNNLSNKVSNLFLMPGDKNYNDLLDGKVILITNIMGMHTTNHKEGSLNVSCSGVLFENKRLINVLKDIKLNEKIQDLFKNVEISKETKWIGNYNLPYLLCLRKN